MNSWEVSIHRNFIMKKKISNNKEWVSAGIFADEAITGTKVEE